MNFIGKINIEIYKCITEDIKTDEVIITDERVEHINERHPEHFDVIKPFLGDALLSPNYILEDKKPNTGLILKNIESENKRFQIVLRVQTSKDNEKYKNSIISAWVISETRWNTYTKNKKILYKDE